MTQQWLEEKSRLKAKAELVRSNKELQMIDKDEVDYLFGLFGETHIRFGDQRVPEEDPTITEMTTKAIEVFTSAVSLSPQILYLPLIYSSLDKKLKFVSSRFWENLKTDFSSW